MKEFPTEGDELKKLMKVARKLPLNFGYNPGTSDDDDQFLALHKRKPPEVLGRIALHDGAGTKSAFGVLEVKGNVVTLTCEREIPQLAKRVKKLLRLNKMNLNVQVLDRSGNVIDAVIEDIEPAAEGADDDEGPGTTADAVSGGTPSAAAPEGGGDARALAARLKALQSGLKSAPAPAAARLERAFASAIGFVRSGELEKAAQLIGLIESTLVQLAPGTGHDAAS